MAAELLNFCGCVPLKKSWQVKPYPGGNLVGNCLSSISPSNKHDRSLCVPKSKLYHFPDPKNHVSILRSLNPSPDTYPFE